MRDRLPLKPFDIGKPLQATENDKAEKEIQSLPAFLAIAAYYLHSVLIRAAAPIVERFQSGFRAYHIETITIRAANFIAVSIDIEIQVRTRTEPAAFD